MMERSLWEPLLIARETIPMGLATLIGSAPNFEGLGVNLAGAHVGGALPPHPDPDPRYEISRYGIGLHVQQYFRKFWNVF